MHAPRIDSRKSGPIRGVLQESLAGLLPSLAVRIAHNRRADVGDGEANKVGTVADRLDRSSSLMGWRVCVDLGIWVWVVWVAAYV
jgi:hypothetical protein